MPSAALVVASAILSLAVQAQLASVQPPGGARVPGIVERPGSVRLPGTIEVQPRASDPAVERELRAARRDIDRRRENGELSRREARQLRRESRRIEHLAERYARDGLSDSERQQLELHAKALRSQTAAGAAQPGPRAAGERSRST